jgi:DNA-binding transcriptional LysR family regulator
VEIRDLRYLAASIGAGNFRRAAKELGLEVSTVSRRISQLEDEIGLTILERGHSGIRLTAGGRAVMIHVTRALAELDTLARAGRELGLGQEGSLRLGLRLPPTDPVLVGTLAAWHAAHPRVALKIAEASDGDLALALREHRLDVVITPLLIPAWQSATALTLYRDHLMAVLPENHRLANQAEIALDDLREDVVLAQGWESSNAARNLYAELLGSRTNIQVHSGSKQTIFALVAAGFGVTLALASFSRSVVPGVVFKPITGRQTSMEMALVWEPGSADAVVGRFVAFMRDKLAKR